MFEPGFTHRQIETANARIHVAQGGSGPPLLLLHGYPQTHLMWHRVVPALLSSFTLVCPDLRGYGDSSKPAGQADHANYSKRAMAQDMVEVMSALGFDRFAMAGHDRGARVGHRLALDHPAHLTRLCVMDIAPTLHMFDHTDQAFATGYYHWFFLIQPDGLPERLIGNDAAYYLREKLRRWAAPGAHFDPAVVEDYIRCFATAEGIHASCEDYRAAATIDLEHDRASRDQRVRCPLLVLWGDKGFVNRSYDVLTVWRNYASDVVGHTVSSGHFLPEEAPDEVADALIDFFKETR